MNTLTGKEAVEKMFEAFELSEKPEWTHENLARALNSERGKQNEISVVIVNHVPERLKAAKKVAAAIQRKFPHYVVICNSVVGVNFGISGFSIEVQQA